jgi:hypothetical protein
MMLRLCVISSVFALAATLGCGPVYTEVEFEPLDEAGSTSSAGGAAVPAGASGGQPAAEAGGRAQAAGAGMPSGAARPDGGAGGADSNAAGASTAGSGGATLGPCATLTGWQTGPYQLGQRVRSTCLAPYNGSCPVSETHEFECQPPTGAVALGWCTDRQPGVVNGWGEAWIMHGVCPAP